MSLYDVLSQMSTLKQMIDEEVAIEMEIEVIDEILDSLSEIDLTKEITKYKNELVLELTSQQILKIGKRKDYI